MVAKFTVDFQNAGPEERADLWADTVRPLFFVSPIGEARHSAAQLAQGWLVDRLVFCEAKFDALVSHRTKKHSLDAPGALVVQSYVYGDNICEVGGQPGRIGTGEVNLTDYGREHRCFHASPTHVHSMIVAHELVGYDPSIHPATMRFPTDTVIGHVIYRTLMAIHEKLDQTTDAEAPAIANGFIGLMRAVLFNDPQVAQSSLDFGTARTRAIRGYVDENVRTGPISAEAVCQEFGISRATLYRNFKEDGGFDRFVIGRRLEAALKVLTLGAAKRGAVSRTAAQLGFSSTSHFSREFRSRFGFAPSDIMGMGCGLNKEDPKIGLQTPGAKGDVFERFIRSL